jgi:hypothetical protein
MASARGSIPILPSLRKSYLRIYAPTPYLAISNGKALQAFVHQRPKEWQILNLSGISEFTRTSVLQKCASEEVE